MKTNRKNFFRQLWLWIFLLIPLSKINAQQHIYIQNMKYTDVAFSVYFANCDYNQVRYTQNGNPFPVTNVFASGGFIANRFPYGILKVGDVFTVTNPCDGTSVSRVIEDDFSYVEVPNGNSYTGNGISSTDSDPPYTRLQTPIQIGQCEVVRNINAHILDSYFFSMNSPITFGSFKHNGISIVQSDYSDDHYGQSVSWHINSDGSVYTDNATKLTSIQLYSGVSPQTISYTHNGAVVDNDLTIQFGGLAIRYIQNGSYSIEKSTAAGFQKTDYNGSFNNSTFEIRYNSSTIEAWVDGVKMDELSKDVQYTVSGGGTLSHTAGLPYGTPVDFTPTTSGDYTLTAIVNGIRKVEQKIHIADTPTMINTVINANCPANVGIITSTGNDGFGALRYSLNGGFFSDNNTFINLNPGTYAISVKDASGCVFTSSASVSVSNQNPSLSLTSTSCAADLKTYQVNFASDGAISSSVGTVSGNTVTGIPAGTNIILTATSSANCQTTLAVNAPNCACPSVNAPISGGNQMASCVGSAIPSVSAMVNSGEVVDWYDTSTGGNLLTSAATTYQPNAIGIFYAEARNTTTGCISATRTSVTVSQNVLPNLSLVSTSCSSDLKTYQVNFSSDGSVSSSAGTVSGNTVTGIPAGTNIILTATSSANCQTTLAVNAPNCACPTVNAPISGGNQTTSCVGSAIPSVSATVNSGEVVDWYDAATGGNLLASAATTYQPTLGGTFYAEARNTTTACISATRTNVTVSQNALPNLSLTSTSCTADLKTYQVNFTSDGTVSSSVSTVSGNVVTGIPAGTNIILTATSLANCQTTLSINAPNCACPTVNAPISGGNQTTSCAGSAIPAISVKVNTGETADWYDAATGGNLLASSTTYQTNVIGIFYAEARNTTTGCISTTRTNVTVSQNALPNLSLASTSCTADLKTYQVNFTSDGTVSSNIGTVSGNTVSGIPAGTNIVLTATSSANCQTTIAVNAPNCACPTVNAPISRGNQTTSCAGSAIPAISVKVNTGETADWYDAATGGNLLASSTTYQPNAIGIFYAEARNTTTGCISATRTNVTVSQNTLPNLSLTSTSCTADLKTYQVNFTSDGTVSSSAGTVSGNTVSSIPAGTNIILTATSSANCQTILNVNAPNCACPTVNAPISRGNQTTSCVGSPIPAISATVNSGETVDWYDASTGGNLLASSTTYQPNAIGIFHAEARNITTNCISATRTSVTVSQNALPSLSLASSSCSSDLKTYQINFSSYGSVSSSAGTVLGNTISGIPAGTDIILTATSLANCQTTLAVNAPNCACPSINAPISGGNQTASCVGSVIPTISVTVNTGETADWYDAATGGNLLASAATTYQPTLGGTFYAQARNTTTGCISATRTSVTVIVNNLPSISANEPICSLDIKTYSFTFTSNGTVSTSVGTISGNTISAVPAGANVTLTATSSAGCQVSRNIIAPNCSPCLLKANADATTIVQGQSTNLHASGCNGGYFVWENTGKDGSDITVQPITTTTYRGACWFAKEAPQCTIEITITVIPCHITATVSKDNITQGESVTLSASGCENGYLIWAGSNSESPTINVKPLETTTYTAKCWYANSNGNESCVISKTINVRPCQLTATASKENIIQGESITLSASGCENGYLIWAGSNSESHTISVMPLVSTTYTAHCWYISGVASCNVSKTIYVRPCQLTATASKENITQGESVTLSASGCENGYLIWAESNSESHTISVMPLVSTTYTAKCWYAGSNGNESCSISKTIGVTPCHLKTTVSKAILTLGESFTIASTGCLGTLIYPQDTTQNGRSVFNYLPNKTQDFTIQCQIGNLISCDTIIHISVTPCHLSAVVQKAMLTLGESFTITSTGCMGTLIYPQDTTQNGKSVFNYLPNKTQDYTIQCQVGNIISCDTSINISVKPCHLSALAEKVRIMGGESVTITSSGCMGTLMYPQDTTQNGKSVFNYLPSKTQDYTIQCKVGNIISCDTIISIAVDKCPSVIQASASSIIKDEYTTLSYESCPNTVVWKALGIGSNKKVNPTKTTTYYASCNYGDKLQFACSSDSIVIKVRPKQPILENTRLGASSIALQDTICLNNDLLMQINCEQGASPFWNGIKQNQLKVDASQVGTQTYQFYCQNDDDGEKSDESKAAIVVKGFEVEEAIVYPNPTTGLLRIKSKGCLDNLHLVLYTLYGQVLYEGNGEYRTSDSISIDLTYLPSNEYVLHILGKQGTNGIVTKRLRVIKYTK